MSPRQRVATPSIKSPEEIKKMEKSGRIVADTLSLLKKYIKPGTKTIELDKIAEDFIRSHNAEPAFKGYQVDKLFFPNTLCISIDEEVVHGIPSDRELKEGEIVSIDCGAELDGYFGDSAMTYAVGEISDEKKKLMEVTQNALMLGIEQAVDKNKVYDISRAVQEYVEKHGFSLTRELVGHGIGTKMHEEPPVPNFVPPLLHRNQYPNVKLKSGMTICIEPMVHAGGKEIINLDDGWTIITKDRRPAAHFEHMIAIGENEAIILTQRD
jgi:methionyl aminopeptidase